MGTFLWCYHTSKRETYTLTNQLDCTLSPALLEQLAAQGLDALPELIRIVINQTRLFERAHFLAAAHYERTEQRAGYANGYKSKTVNTRPGQVTFEVPQVRESEAYFYSKKRKERMRDQTSLCSRAVRTASALEETPSLK